MSEDLKSVTEGIISMVGDVSGTSLEAGLINMILGVFWPNDSRDQYWDEIKDKVKAYVDEQLIEAQKQELDGLLNGDATIQGGIKEWLTNAKKHTGKDRLNDFQSIIDALINNASKFADLTRAAETISYFVQMATAHLFALASVIQMLQKHPSLNAHAAHSLSWYQDEFKEKSREYRQYAFQAVQAAVQNRYNWVTPVQKRWVDDDNSSQYFFNDGWPNSNFPGYSSLSFNDANDHRSQYLSLITLPYKKFWRDNALASANLWGRDAIKDITGSPYPFNSQPGIYQAVSPYLVFRTSDNLVFLYDYLTEGFLQLNGKNGVTDAPLAAGDPRGISSFGQLHVAYMDAKGIVWDVRYSPDASPDQAWSKLQINNQQTGNQGLTTSPAGKNYYSVPVFADSAGLHFIFQSDDLWDAWLNNGTWQCAQLTGSGGKAAGAPSPAGTGNVICATVMIDNISNIAYLAVDSYIWTLYGDGVNWTAGNLSTQDPEKMSADGQLTIYAARDQNHFIYKRNQCLCDVHWDRRTWVGSLFGGGPGTYVAYQSTAYANCAGWERLVFEALDENGPNGQIAWIYYDGQNWYQDVLNGGERTTAPSSPNLRGMAAFAYNNSEYVLYVDQKGVLYELCCDSSGNWTWRTLNGAKSS